MSLYVEFSPKLIAKGSVSKDRLSNHDSGQLPGATDTAASFQFEGEGHTLGNALRFAIMKKYVGVVLNLFTFGSGGSLVR